MLFRLKVATCVLLTCSLLAIPGQAFAEEPLKVLRDIAYCGEPESDYQRERCKLDLYLPANADGFPTLVWFHGGGLQGGHKADDIAVIVAKRLSAAGIAVASPNYRLHPEVEFPAYVEDAAAAYAFIRGQIAEHGGDPSRVFISGHSAGGYLTAMVGLAPQYLEKHGIALADVPGILPVSGQFVTHSTVRTERGVPRTRPLIDDAAPAWYVSASAPPTLCIVGGEDLPARAEENHLFVAFMKSAEHPDVACLKVPGRDHGTIANRIGEADDPVARAMIEFIESHKRGVN